MRRLVTRGLAVLLALLLAGGCLPVGGRGGTGDGVGTSTLSGAGEQGSAGGTDEPDRPHEADPADEADAPDEADAVGQAAQQVALPDVAVDPANVPGDRNGPVALLVKRLTLGASLEDSFAATREALAMGGIATWDGETFLKEAVSPAASTKAIPREVAVLALEARQRASAGRLTLAQMGEMLQDLGWPFQSGSTPGEQLRAILAGWVADGLARPDAPLSFAPLFLQEMALVQQPAIDIAGARYAPGDLRLTLLEMELFAAHFDRISRPPKQAAWRPFGGWLESKAEAAEVCSAAKEWLGKGLGDANVIVDIDQLLASQIVGDGMGNALQAAGLSEAGADGFGKALSAIGIAGRVLKLISIYSEAQVAVTLESANPIHKGLESEARILSGFRARAGVSDEDWKAYTDSMTSSGVMRGLRDCFATFGMPVIPDLGDMGKEAQNWSVEWRLPEGAGQHAYISLDTNQFYLPGQLEMKLEKDGDHSASALLVVDIVPEQGKAHSGPVKQGKVVAEAALETASPPSIGSWVNALKGGAGDLLALADVLVELGAGWIQEMRPPKAYATLNVTYHEGGAGAWTGTITYSKTRAIDETKTGQKKGEYSFAEHTVESDSRTATIWIGGSDVNNTGQEQVYTLRGDSTSAVRETRYSYYRGEDDGCRGEGVATSHERSYSLTETSGSGPAEAQLTILNNGGYRLHVPALPEMSGFRVSEWRSWWENKPCVDGDEEYQDSGPVEGWALGSFSVAGKVDPKKPDVIEGVHDDTDQGGNRVIITWRLERQT